MKSSLEQISRDALNPDFRKPFIVDEYTYATNGSAILRVKGRYSDVTEPPIEVYKLDWSVFDQLSKGIAVSRSNIFTINKPVRHCPECNGTGEVHFVNSYNTYECECMSCDGNGQIKPMLVWKVATDWFLFLSLLELIIKSVGDITYFPEKADKLVPFTFEGGEGFIAPTTFKDKDVKTISGQGNLFDPGHLFEVVVIR